MTDLSAIDQFEFEPRMSDADALMWSIEKDPLLRSTITFVTFLDQAPDRERFTRVMDRASRVVPRLRQRVLGHPYSIAPPRWEVDPNFDLAYHLRWMRTIDDGTAREVFEIAEPIAMQGFDRARPLWEFTVVEGLADGKAAVIGKVHHAITDGVGGMKLQMEMLDLERHPTTEREMPPEPAPHDLGEGRRMVDAMRYEAERQLGSVHGLVGSAIDRARRLAADPVGVGVDAVRTGGSVVRLLSPATKPLSPLMVGRSLSVRFDMLQVPLGELKGAARIVQGHLNDAFVGGVAGGLRLYHEHHGYTVDDLRMTMPINVRDASTANRAGNQFVPARFPVPVGIDDPLRRMNAIRELVAQQRAEPALALSDPLAGLLNRLPVSATTAVFGSMLKGVDFITSNVPGAPIPVFMAGAAVEAQVALGPMTGSSCNVVLLSYQDDVNLGITMDPAAIADHDVFVDCLREGFAEITKLA